LNQKKTAGDNIVSSNLDWYIDILLPQCLCGVTQEVGENKAIIEPNLERAKILYEKLYELANPIQRAKLEKIMHPALKNHQKWRKKLQITGGENLCFNNELKPKRLTAWASNFDSKARLSYSHRLKASLIPQL